METGSSQKVGVQVIVEEAVLRGRFVEQGGKLFVGGEERGCKKLLWGNGREMTTCSSRGSEFSSHHPYQATHNCL